MRRKEDPKPPAPEYLWRGKLREPHPTSIPRGQAVDTRVIGSSGMLADMDDAELDKFANHVDAIDDPTDS